MLRRPKHSKIEVLAPKEEEGKEEEVNDNQILLCETYICATTQLIYQRFSLWHQNLCPNRETPRKFRLYEPNCVDDRFC